MCPLHNSNGRNRNRKDRLLPLRRVRKISLLRRADSERYINEDA
jgi:hypothetical protein